MVSSEMAGRKTGVVGRLRPSVVAASVAGFAFASLVSHPAAAETRSYVISWLLNAANAEPGDKDCPDGLNPLPEDLFRTELKGIGMKDDEVEKILSELNGGNSSPATRNALLNRGRIDGKPAHAYTYPASVPDPHLHEVKGKYAYGFDLDGKQGPNSFEDPETHEKGVDNEFWRAMGCNINHRGSPKEPPTKWALGWDNGRDKNPALLITLTSDDFSKEGADVTVGLYRAMERITRDANAYVRADSTFRIDPNPRWHNVLHGKIKNGEVWVTEPKDILLAFDPYHFAEFEVKQTHLRLKFNDDRSIEGVLGGYVPWRRVMFVYGSSGYNEETMIGTDIPGAYHTITRHADAYPDPKTGRNTAISSAWRIVAVPAFTIDMEKQQQAKN